VAHYYKEKEKEKENQKEKEKSDMSDWMPIGHFIAQACLRRHRRHFVTYLPLTSNGYSLRSPKTS
jgi:hypothetical protein